MVIHTWSSPSHEPLLAIWSKSLESFPWFETVIHRLTGPSSGDYGDEGWQPINRKIWLSAYDVVVTNIGKTIGFTDCDVAFMRNPMRGCRAPLDRINLAQMMEAADILFQRERPEDDLFNPGVMFVDCSPWVAQSILGIISRLDEWDGHLPHQNAIMKDEFRKHGVAYSLAPANDFANPSNGGSIDHCLLFHANCTPPPNCVEQKLAMLRPLL